MPTNKNAKNHLAKQIRQMLDLPPTSPKRGKIKPAWLRLTEETNALDYLEKAVFYIRETQKTRVAWKWVILAFHGALYGFAIAALKGTNPENVYQPKSTHSLKTLPDNIRQQGFPAGIPIKYRPEKQQLEFRGTMSSEDRETLLGLSEARKYRTAIEALFTQSHHLISFPEAIKRCQDPGCMRMTVTSKWLEPTAEQREAVRKLHKLFRNNFVHYKPMAWLIELHGQPNLAAHVLDVIRFLALETGNYVHLTPAQTRKVKSLVYQGKRLLTQSPLYLKPEKRT